MYTSVWSPEVEVGMMAHLISPPVRQALMDVLGIPSLPSPAGTAGGLPQSRGAFTWVPGIRLHSPLSHLPSPHCTNFSKRVKAHGFP